MALSQKQLGLGKAGALHRHPERVSDERFGADPFFDSNDRAQVKYEMVRSHAVDGVSVAQAARQFGYSREQFYGIAKAFQAYGMTSLFDAKPGRKRPDKLTPEVEAFARRAYEQDRTLSGAALAKRVRKEFHVRIHRRTFERAIARWRTRKKNG